MLMTRQDPCLHPGLRRSFAPCSHSARSHVQPSSHAGSLVPWSVSCQRRGACATGEGSRRAQRLLHRAEGSEAAPVLLRVSVISPAARPEAPPTP